MHINKLLSLSCAAAFFAVSSLSGCADYKANMHMRTERARYKAQERPESIRAVNEIVKTVISAVEDAKKDEAKDSALQLLAKNPTLNDHQTALIAIASIAEAQARYSGKAEIARARSEAIRYLQPIVESIYRDLEEKIGTPPTAADVGMALVNQLPALSTVYGMYSLGAKGIEAAGDTISATLSDNASMAAGGSINNAANGAGAAAASGDAQGSNAEATAEGASATGSSRSQTSDDDTTTTTTTTTTNTNTQTSTNTSN